MVGDATDLQPAAARMRYTRLRKAVEAGHFKGATLVQPNLITATLSGLANPHSRRLNNTPYGEEHEQPTTDLREDDPAVTLRAQLEKPVSLDEEEEEEDDDEGEVIQGLEHLTRRKRRGSNTDQTLMGDNDLFFPDTSRSSRGQKRIKRSDSDLEGDEGQDRSIARSDRNARADISRSSVGRTPAQPQVYDQTYSQGEASHLHEQYQRAATPMYSSTVGHRVQHNYGDGRQSTPTSRKKQSANAAAEAAHSMGVRLDKWAPYAGDDNFQSQTAQYIAPPNYAQRLAYARSGNFWPATDPAWYDTNIGSNAANPKSHNAQLHGAVYPYQAYSQGPYNHPAGSFLAISPDSLSGSNVTSHHTRSSAQNGPAPEPQPQSRTSEAPQSYKPSEPNRFHPASVFEGFHAPNLPFYSPSTRAGTGIQQNGQVSLLHKVMMERGKDKKSVQSPKDQQEKVDNKLSGDGSSGSATKQATHDRREQESEAVPNTDTADSSGNNEGSRPTRARSPIRRRTTSTGTVVATQGDTTETK